MPCSLKSGRCLQLSTRESVATRRRMASSALASPAAGPPPACAAAPLPGCWAADGGAAGERGLATALCRALAGQGCS
ncbi:hypothetical protein ADJ79_09955 [Ottowia sp. oral taxon 894]|nr:hypothetical protein ADJ79_09955 [Ottowia sp. oral taxon 894]